MSTAHNFSYKGDLLDRITKLRKRDPTTYDILLKKMNEIVESGNLEHYKNLREPLQHLKRVHVRGPFVLTFRFVEEENKIVFYDLDHHDHIYLH